MNQEKRIEILRALIKAILSGKINSKQESPEKIYSPHPKPRQEYISPQHRDGNNYGYMTDGEIGAGNQESL